VLVLNADQCTYVYTSVFKLSAPIYSVISEPDHNYNLYLHEIFTRTLSLSGFSM